MKKSHYFLISGLLIIFLVIGLILLVLLPKSSPSQQNNSSSEASIIMKEEQAIKPKNHFGTKDNQHEQALNQFIQTKMTSEYGIVTNYIDTDQVAKTATGHEILSESAGLMLRYLALTGQKKEFGNEWNLTLKTVDDGTQFSYRYSPKLAKRYDVNASVDDLRILRSLKEAGSKFHDIEYEKDFEKYANRFIKTSIKENELYDFYDSKTKMNNDFITLCYIDLKTISLLPGNQTKLLENQTTILQNGYLGDTFPFYKTRFNYSKNDYQDSAEINVIESLLAILHLSEVGLQKQASIDYLKEQVNDGTLSNRYDSKGKPIDLNQSPAAYGIAAMIASEAGDEEFYLTAMNKMETYQIMDEASPLYGGYGDTETNQVYSFNNLIALLAYQY
ncbi:hypothetical protein BFC22_00315 [Carnobacterium divergens]|uniref:hypothetical protein n=1 Tax=Carnobacterium divergens TaxID=2748 RepID=UPI000E74F980|nr:hypothetical protein [Carnobacterium divergens]ANZ98631.1 hypothetical protein BFC22_00315 [Carnobacterium divergens]